jgi:tetratricopeptide (TPR) repeat protein
VLEVDDLPEAWLGLASAEHALGSDDAAREAVRRALRLGYQRAAVAMAAGELAYRLGDREVAVDAFAAAIRLIPNLAADPYWATLDDEAFVATVVDAAIESSGPDGRWEIRWMAGDADEARELARSLDPEARRRAEQIIDAWAGNTEAVEGVLDDCAARPLDIVAVQWCARLEGQLGNADERERYRAWAEAITGGASAAGAETRVSTTTLVGRSLEGEVASFWGTYTYRRPTAWDVLAPDLIHLTLK